MADMNDFAGQFAQGALTVTGVYRTALKPGRYEGHTQAYPTSSAGLVFAVCGEAVFTFDGTHYELRKGTIVHGGKQMTLSLMVGEQGFEYVLVHYSLLDAKGTDMSVCRSHFRLGAKLNSGLEGKLTALYQAGAIPGPIYAVRVKELFYGLLHDLLTGSRETSHKSGGTIVERTLAYIHENYMETISLNSLAGMQGMEAKPFAYLFRKYAGLFPIDYVIQYRIKKAMQLLAATDKSISDIAACVGYADAHYFSRLFKRHAGRSPSAFRAGLGNNPLPDSIIVHSHR